MPVSTIVRTYTATETNNRIKSHILRMTDMGRSAAQINAAMAAAGYGSTDVDTALAELQSEGKITYT